MLTIGVITIKYIILNKNFFDKKDTDKKRHDIAVVRLAIRIKQQV